MNQSTAIDVGLVLTATLAVVSLSGAAWVLTKGSRGRASRILARATFAGNVGAAVGFLWLTLALPQLSDFALIGTFMSAAAAFELLRRLRRRSEWR